MSASYRDLGWYVRADGRRKLLTWWADGAVTLDGPGGVEFLGNIATEELALQVFKGWEDDDTRPVSWVHARMLAAATGACADCGGSGRKIFRDPFTRRGLIDSACPTCIPVEAQ